MKAPQIIMIVLIGISLLISAHSHGEERDDHNFWTALISAGITIGLLTWGGFF